MNFERTRQYGYWLLVAGATLAYLLPWLVMNSAGLNLGAYDLADLLSKQPIDYSSDIYLIILLLRGQLLLWTWYLSQTVRRLFTLDWWLTALFCTVLIVAQLPPLNALSRMDINQQQQMILVILSSVGASCGLAGILTSQRHVIGFLLCFVGISTSSYTIWQAMHILQAYVGYVAIGIGYLLMIVVYGTAMVWHGWDLLNGRQRNDS